MTSFQGYEVVPAEGMVRHGRTTIRITVSAKKVCLSRLLIELCKEMVRQYGKGEFKPGIFFTVKGEKVEDGIEFDFRKVLYREVKPCTRKRTAVRKYAAGKRKSPGKSRKPAAKTEGHTVEDLGFTGSMGFSMPSMGSMAF